MKHYPIVIADVYANGIYKWVPADLAIALVDELTEDPVVTIEVKTPNGLISIMGEPREVGRLLVVAGVHISSRGIEPNDIGIGNLRMIARLVMEELDYDGLVVEGETRTTGANPSHRPRPIRFARDRRVTGRR